tara:strand:+ start:11209 stop:11538 length:330 start_codon:yes stop_codon:yes gene_type:complete
MSKKIARTNRRTKATKEKKAAEKELSAKIALFSDLTTECLVCQAPFDKTNKEQVTTWSVIVRKAEDKVNLYCPECWTKALGLVQEYLAQTRTPAAEPADVEEMDNDAAV